MNFTKRQLEIIEKAMKVIGNDGLQELTTKRLAEEMGFSEPALYRHFENKTDILNSVLIHYQSILKEGLFEILNQSSSGLDRIIAIIDHQFSVFSEKPEIIMVIFSESSFQHDSVLQETVVKTMEQKENRITRIIAEGQQDGSIRQGVDARSLANVIMGSMRFVALRWKLSGFRFDVQRESTQLQQTITQLIKHHKK